MPEKSTICAADQAQGGDHMALLLEDLEALAEHHNPHRDGVLQLALEFHAERYGPSIPVNMFCLNKILATYGQPLASLIEVNIWYGDRPPVEALN